MIDPHLCQARLLEARQQRVSGIALAPHETSSLKEPVNAWTKSACCKREQEWGAKRLPKNAGHKSLDDEM